MVLIPLSFNFSDQYFQFPGCFIVHVGFRFIQEEDIRNRHQGPGDGDSFLFTPRQLQGFPFFKSFQTHHAESRCRFFTVSLPAAFLKSERCRQVVVDRSMKQVGFLMNKDGPKGPGGADFAFRGRDQVSQQFQKCGFSRAVMTPYPGDPSFSDGQVGDPQGRVSRLASFLLVVSENQIPDSVEFSGS